LATRVTPGQAADTKQLEPLLDDIAVPRPGKTGRPRKHPDSLTGDKAYGSKANRALLRSKKIKTVIPERRDQVNNRLRKGSAGGRPPSFDSIQYKQRNQVERGFNRRKQFRAVATRYDKLGEATGKPPTTWSRSSTGSAPHQTKPDHDPADTP
jgi:transposase